MASAGCNITYQVSRDKIRYYYWSGGFWSLALGQSQSNSADVINTNISSFPVIVGNRNLFWKAYINSVGGQSCDLQQVNIISGSKLNPQVSP